MAYPRGRILSFTFLILLDSYMPDISSSGIFLPVIYRQECLFQRLKLSDLRRIIERAECIFVIKLAIIVPRKMGLKGDICEAVFRFNASC